MNRENFENCKKALDIWNSGIYKTSDDFIGSLEEDIFIGVGREIFQFLNQYNTSEQLRKVYNVTCENCAHYYNNKCNSFDYRENCLNEEIGYSWLKHISNK